MAGTVVFFLLADLLRLVLLLVNYDKEVLPNNPQEDYLSTEPALAPSSVYVANDLVTQVFSCIFIG